MKPESIKTILRSYLKEKQQSSNSGYHGISYSEVADFDGIPCTSFSLKYESGKPFHAAKNRDDTLIAESGLVWVGSDDLEGMQSQAAGLPWNEHNVPLRPQMDELAIRAGRRLSQMSDEFDLIHIVPVHNQIFANGLQPEEQQCIKNIFSRTRSISISEIATCLREKLTCNTFKAALRCLCNNADTIPKELALGAELFRLTTQHRPVHVTLLTNAFCEYFSYLPELEELVHLF